MPLDAPCERATHPINGGEGSRRKGNLGMDLTTSGIRAVELTPGRDGDSRVLPDLLGQIPEA